jgi:hypothetical protein
LRHSGFGSSLAAPPLSRDHPNLRSLYVPQPSIALSYA